MLRTPKVKLQIKSALAYAVISFWQFLLFLLQLPVAYPLIDLPDVKKRIARG